MPYDSQNLIKLTVEQMHEGIQIIDYDWKYVYLNAAAVRHAQREIETLVGHGMEEAYPGIEKTPVYALIREVMDKRTSRHLENEFVYRDGSKCWFELFIEPHAAGVLIRSIDISHRKKIEEQYMYSQKLEAIGRLAGGIAHDFNNKLGIMMLYCEMAQSAPAAAQDPEISRYVENILAAINQATSLTKQLLAFGRKQVLDMKIVNLNDILNSSAKNLGSIIGAQIEMNLHLEKDLWKVRVDKSQIEQVILNLVINSRDSIEKSGVITIETANAELDKAYASRHHDVVPGEYVMISISDNGSGMTPEVRDKLFEPFFTTKELGKGTGLGLAAVHGIVNQSRGHIWAYSEEGIGTSFKIYFPRVIDKVEEKPVEAHGTNIKGRGERILLVEDDSLLKEAFQQTLTAAGYHVITAGDADEAQVVFCSEDKEFDLLLTDVVLPRANGNELAKLLRAMKPELKVAFMSGYTENSIVHHGVLDTDSVLIQKPITTQNLLLTVRRILDLKLKKGLY